MMSFIIRVELHGVKHDEVPYTSLHGAMRAAGFSRTITGSDGKTYHLPPAQYHAEGAHTIEYIRGVAAKAAEKANRPFAVLVTQGQSAWQGLAAA